jgi:DNA polymerase-1
VLIIIDGMAMAFRSWYSIPGSIRSGGIDEAVPLAGYMFLDHLMHTVEDISLDYSTEEIQIVVCWDSPHSSDRRKQLVKESGVVDRGYKEHRVAKLTDEKRDAYQAVTILFQNLSRVHSQFSLSDSNFEADDLIALLTGVSEGAVIVSRDQDFYQLLNDNVLVYNPNASEYITRDSFTKKYKFSPIWWALWKAIAGDSSDNWPGVAGIGPVRTTKYIQNLVSFGVNVEEGIRLATKKWGRIVPIGLDLVTIPFKEFSEPTYIKNAFEMIITCISNSAASDWGSYFDTFDIQRLSISNAKRILTPTT